MKMQDVLLRLESALAGKQIRIDIQELITELLLEFGGKPKGQSSPKEKKDEKRSS